MNALKRPTPATDEELSAALARHNAAMPKLHAARNRIQQQIDANCALRADTEQQRRHEALVTALGKGAADLDALDAQLRALLTEHERLQMQMREISDALNTTTDEANRIGGELAGRRRARDLNATKARLAAVVNRFDRLMEALRECRTDYFVSVAELDRLRARTAEAEHAVNSLRGGGWFVNLAETAAWGSSSSDTLSTLTAPLIDRVR